MFVCSTMCSTSERQPITTSMQIQMNWNVVLFSCLSGKIAPLFVGDQNDRTTMQLISRGKLKAWLRSENNQWKKKQLPVGEIMSNCFFKRFDGAQWKGVLTFFFPKIKPFCFDRVSYVRLHLKNKPMLNVVSLMSLSFYWFLNYSEKKKCFCCTYIK